MSKFQTFAPSKAREVFLVAYHSSSGPRAAAFSTGVKARDFAACVRGGVIHTSIDRWMIDDETAAMMQGIMAQAIEGGRLDGRR